MPLIVIKYQVIIVFWESAKFQVCLDFKKKKKKRERVHFVLHSGAFGGK